MDTKNVPDSAQDDKSFGGLSFDLHPIGRIEAHATLRKSLSNLIRAFFLGAVQPKAIGPTAGG
jgi:hypothetical protein